MVYALLNSLANRIVAGRVAAAVSTSPRPTRSGSARACAAAVAHSRATRALELRQLSADRSTRGERGHYLGTVPDFAPALRRSLHRRKRRRGLSLLERHGVAGQGACHVEIGPDRSSSLNPWRFSIASAAAGQRSPT